MQAYSESVSGLKRLRNDPQANTIACLIGVRGGGEEKLVRKLSLKIELFTFATPLQL